jgi:tRNA A-37 threonylcarbamoyl transferase component Bud32
MTDANSCPHCGKPITYAGLGGVCPECMLKAGVPTQEPAAAAPSGGSGAAKPPGPPAPAEIARQFPHLEILECLGRGGMGMVYKARQPKLNRLVALKLLAPEKEADPKFAERFTREAQALARLSHPNIVTVYDFGETGGQFFLLMEYVDGVSLRQTLHGGRVKPEEALAIVPRICEALQYAHQQGVVHRDIKPENILLDKEGRVKIADFGIAKIVGGDRSRESITQDQQVVGTPHYMAPEQVEKPQTVDHRADIYSLGVVFYEMLTGELPLGKFAPPSRKVEVDVRLDEVVLRTLEKEPERRYQQASQVRTAVETIAGSASAPAGPTGRPAAVAPPQFGNLVASLFGFSRLAIVGALWIPACFATLTILASDDVPPPGGMSLLEQIVLALGASGIFGATILGCLAVAQIRRSEGRLFGLGLAVFDGMFIPLLALDGLLLVGGMALFGFFRQWRPHTPLAMVLIGLGILALDFLILRGVWRAVNRKPDGPPPPLGRILQVFVVGSMTLGFLAVAAVVHLWCCRIVDDIHLSFVDDPRAIGRWTTVDFVNVPEQFTPDSRSWRHEFFFKEIALLPGGKTTRPNHDWTKGLLLNKEDRTAESYSIREIGGTNYLFMQWKSGEYTLLHKEPSFYVLRWSGSVAGNGRGSTSPQSSQTPAPDAAFGPVMERVVNDEGATNSLLDLDTGRFVTIQPATGPLSLDQTRNQEAVAFARVGADVAGLSPKVSEVSGLMGFDLVASPTLADSWDTASVRWVKDALASFSSGSITPMSAKGKLPATFVFKTREGATGLLQILGFTDRPSGVRIRYKLAQ